jgi:hypothetical protein
VLGRETVHGEKVQKDESAFEIIHVLSPSFKGPDDEPLSLGTFLKWKLSFVTNEMGNTLEAVLVRAPTFANYLNNRKYAREEYEKLLMNRRNLQIGDHVIINIMKGIDRTNTDKRNFEAEVIEVSKDMKTVRVASNAGRLTQWFQQEQLELIRGQKRKLSIQDRDIEFTKACRYETAYGEHEAMGNTICKCNLTSKGHCLNKKQCPCFKANLKCSSKCHLGKVCDLPK